jgi:hypothetical protein
VRRPRMTSADVAALLVRGSEVADGLCAGEGSDGELLALAPGSLVRCAAAKRPQSVTLV